MSWTRTAGERPFGWERWPLAAIIATAVGAFWMIVGAWLIGAMFLVAAAVFALIAVRRR